MMSEHLHQLQLAELFDCVEDALVWVKDQEGRYRWVNQAFLTNYRLANRPASEPADEDDVIGKTDYDLSPAFLADQFRLDDEYVLSGHRIVNRIELVGQPEGQAIWNVTTKIPLYERDGTIIGTAGLTRRLSGPGQESLPGSEFSAVLAYMRDHYHTPITNERLAQLAHMSVRTFERRFRSSFHLTPQRYIRKLQLRVASRALIDTKQSLAEVALKCGFADQSHFSREFRRHFGQTPREYRETYLHRGENDAPGTKSAASEQ